MVLLRLRVCTHGLGKILLGLTEFWNKIVHKKKKKKRKKNPNRQNFTGIGRILEKKNKIPIPTS
jgi:hypothetical protein